MNVAEQRAKKAEDRNRELGERLDKARQLKEQGKSNREIAAAMGISESWVYQLLKRPSSFRPTRTADQIAADLEERGKKMLEFAALLRGEKGK